MVIANRVAKEANTGYKNKIDDLIKDFNPEALTNRQKLLICMYVKEAYDNRDRTAPTDNKVRFAVQSMMLKERLK